MGVFRLERGLVVQRGERKIAFQRQIDAETVQFEDILTGHLEVHKISVFLRNVNTGAYKICGADDGATQSHNIKIISDEKVGVMVLKLADRQRAEWERKCRYVYALRKCGVQRGQHRRITQLLPDIAERLEDSDPPSAWTVMKWLKRFELHGADTISLVSGNALRRSKARIDGELDDLIRRILRKHYFIRNGESLRKAHGRVVNSLKVTIDKKSSPDQVVSESTVRRIASETDPYSRDRARFGAAFAAAKWRHSTGGIYATRPMQRVEMDHTTLDLYVLDDVRGLPLGRPTVTMLIDSYSFYILSIYVSFEGGTLGRMAQAIKFALQPKDELVQSLGLSHQWLCPGLFEILAVDNAPEFHSRHARMMSMEMLFDLEFSPVRKPWFKPHIERAMLELARILPISGRPERFFGVKDVIDPKKNACVIFSDLCNALVKWAVDIHPLHINERKLARPLDLMQEGLATMPPPMYMDDLRSLDVIGGISKSMRVRHSGVEMQHLTYRSVELAAMAKEIAPAFSANIKINPDNLGSIWVQHPTEKSWINVPATHSAYANGLTLFQHRLIRSHAKEKLRVMGAAEALLKAQMELQEMWDVAARSGRKIKASTKQLAVLEGMRSSKIFSEKEKKEPVLAEQIVTREELAVETSEIPDFESFNLSTYMR